MQIFSSKLPWRSDVRAIPFDLPVLVLPQKGLPYMAERSEEYMPDCVECLLKSDGYGFYESIDDLVAWLEICEK